MLPLKLEIKNFLAYRSPDAVRFDGVHLACLTGSNGAGKSSLLDAITWALWGKARARRDEELVHLGQVDMYVQLDFEQEGIIYRVIRRRSRKSSSGSLDLFAIEPDGTPNTLSEPSTRATQAKINRLLRLDYDTFVNSAFLQQGKADAFSTKTPKERKQILGDILGLSRWDDYEDAAKTHIKALETDIHAIQVSISEADAEIALEPQYRAQLIEAEIAQADAQATLEFAEARLKEVEFAPNEKRAKDAERARFEAQIKQHELDIIAQENQRAMRAAAIAEYENIIAQRDEIEAGYRILQAARADQQALTPILQKLREYESAHHQLEIAIKNEETALTNERAALQAEGDMLTRTIDAAQPDEYTAVMGEVLTLEATDALRDVYVQEVADMNTERASLDSTNRALKRAMDEMKDRQNRLKRHEGAACPFCGQPLDEHTRLRLIEEIETEGKPRGDEFRTNKARMEAMDAQIKTRRQEIDEMVLIVKRLPALREHGARLQAALQAAEAAHARLAEVTARLGLIAPLLANQSYAPDLRAELIELETLRKALDFDNERLNTAQEQLQTYLEYELRQAQLSRALENLPDQRALLENTIARIDALQRARADDQTGLEAVLVEIVRLNVLVEEEKQRRHEVYQQRTLYNNAMLAVGGAQQQLKSIERLRVHRVALEGRLSAAREDKAVYEELRLAFGKNGIPAMIIESALPELESAANTLLSRMTDGRMHLSIPTQRDKVTGGVAETLDIVIADELGTRSYEMFSGGEAFRIDFALRVALSQMLARRAGAHLRTLFIDEGFGTQDEDGRNKLIEAITAVQDDFDMILVITHIDDLRDSFPVHIAIDKTPDGSRIAVR
jgi:exonuclease SbcC